MSNPQTNTQKPPRRSVKKAQQMSQNSRMVVSDNDVHNAVNDNLIGSGGGKGKSKKKSHATKRSHGQTDAAVHSDGPAQRPMSQHAKVQATPIKQQAYAGPTFHQSPAASALPLPRFYSKSLPTASPLKPGADFILSSKHPAQDFNKTDLPPLPTEVKRETTPLDFLFDAARKANATPGTESPNHRPFLSPAVETPPNHSPAIREGDTDFPFELDAGDQAGGENDPISSTPYKERIKAARSHRTSSAGGKALNEDERKAKTAALKQFLMNTAQSSNSDGDNNPFNARPAPSHHPQFQHRSNPNTPYDVPPQSIQPYFPLPPPLPNAMHYQSPNRQGPPSGLRNVYQPRSNPVADGESRANQPRISTAKDQATDRLNLNDIYTTSQRPSSQNSGHRATPSAQQLEDDLRKFLKLDLVSSG